MIGDPEQLGSIEAGGLFSAIAERTDPVVLDEVIRHNHELDRDAAKLIREGDGREALSLYRSAERVTVAPDAETRREVMVSDWWRSSQEGEDALMVAKRNAEVARLNATARELMRAEGQLGEKEIEVGEAHFAAGDQVITRVNDRANDIYNRERWQVAEVDPGRGRIVLDGIDQTRRVEVGPEYLAETTLGGEAPALQHAYAVTTYCAQGATVDRAYVMADPSMDKQELYVATSRSREQTYLYATPEIHAEREEFAPGSIEDRGALPHLGDAAERDRAQTAAHDEALRAELRQLPTQEIAAREKALDRPLAEESRLKEKHAEERRNLEFAETRYESALDNLERVEALGWRERRRKLPRAQERVEDQREAFQTMRSRIESLEPLRDDARRESAAIRQVLAEREKQALTAARLSPPSYIVKELGDRPSDPTKAKVWDQGVKTIESYRQEHGVTDKRRAFGREPQSSSQKAAREAAQRRLLDSLRRLGRERQLAQAKRVRQSIARGFSIGR